MYFQLISNTFICVKVQRIDFYGVMQMKINLVVRWCYALGSTIRLFHICFTLFYEHRFIHCAYQSNKPRCSHVMFCSFCRHWLTWRRIWTQQPQKWSTRGTPTTTFPFRETRRSRCRRICCSRCWSPAYLWRRWWHCRCTWGWWR